ncbi:hypothetical protein A2480_03035 [Candidatus Uhrbacteria bacterium RIFOXYC2_FULL_47_19]|uniref:Uncharacterized protein n=1 Tax=Candidatus Uhrbacteria bacterium RIFOXYC2_FULL_47_19 TaxID=1802424 RepID=A0A1F7WDV4_9BACT|nr:MAG: hypothetical protein A2480_03035 [Candidatus Uhrbacteria bacterium RIFOXYC2_FULL_47_19]
MTFRLWLRAGVLFAWAWLRLACSFVKVQTKELSLRIAYFHLNVKYRLSVIGLMSRNQCFLWIKCIFLVFYVCFRHFRQYFQELIYGAEGSNFVQQPQPTNVDHPSGGPHLFVSEVRGLERVGASQARRSLGHSERRRTRAGGGFDATLYKEARRSGG